MMTFISTLNKVHYLKNYPYPTRAGKYFSGYMNNVTFPSQIAIL